MEDLYQVGSITQTHGIRGEVKVFPLTDDISRFKNMKNLLLDAGKEGYISLEVENARPQKNLVILKFKGIDNINDIEKYKGHGLYVTKDNRVDLKEDEYFIADLIGCDVYLDSDKDNRFGTISDVMETGANDVYEITLESGKTVLVPAIKDCILDVDIEGRRMEIHLMEGLMD
ncbi:16S rRNA processing protein RimM [Pseudobutyrivibrio sp. JW11]|uniref:ribosome maturation factor RimM n=1 Tax=Pseudobutyrivibrio TaxID=46205 RepID=UPI00051BFC2D|nr:MULTISPECIES: ribosome maturation factor RimM [Pseudobutyrivibrio]MBE5914916.1 16S rRNA processing protein RimM [Pseudobutyrivibrio ruminis]SFO03355.1 16S rRNA processing protein RimM [Pseudobutyrivibrio sp. JW11]